MRQALDLRRQWLIEQELASPQGATTVYRSGLVSQLEQRELTRVGHHLSEELGLLYREPVTGTPIEGKYARRLDLGSGRFAVIERAHDFVIVPWRSVLERGLGRELVGIPRGDSISWSILGGRTGPQVE